MVWIINNAIFRNAKKKQPNITSVGRPARRQSPVSELLRSVFRPLSNGNGPSWIWLVMIRLNYGCDKRVRYCVLIFCAGYCSFRVNYPVGLEKACLRVNRWLSQIANKKKYRVGHKSAIFEKDHRLILIKNYIFWIGKSSAIEWYLSFLLSISWPSDEPWRVNTISDGAAGGGGRLSPFMFFFVFQRQAPGAI